VRRDATLDTPAPTCVHGRRAAGRSAAYQRHRYPASGTLDVRAVDVCVRGINGSMSEQPVSAALEIVVNGAPQRVHPGCTVATLLSDLDMAGRRVAVARNRAIVPRSRFELETLCEGDRVEILEAVGGG
jgi:sulfur carrier protein